QKGKDSLAMLKAYQEVQRECKSRAKDRLDVFLFVEPFGLAQAQRVMFNQPAGRTDMVKVLKQEGFDAIQGVGGAVTFGVEPYQQLFHLVSYAPKPHRKAMQMMRFLPGKEFAVP